ncbi:hypothetical protein [Leptospira alstonii]|uniref:Uncharacterized protein n=2 Tax=Leptospira alstonii TaxID=28452 RepID=M6CQT6_9LEPT|nr:hypothetical protein [Leptospira alstonii]EMJ94069.1 hypothetical protein LEP1GSC194_2238 [Leptospira alstonii serovar Sichuan str. 79601]EQA80408.1 hypothetical protein LEP1GSC193_0009 [Leptospira alstonii serovar Pingchang str. 80-412]
MKDFSERFKPRLLLFLSVDIIDSTIHKYQAGFTPTWLTAFIDFYSEFPVLLNTGITKAREGCSEYNKIDSPKPEIWKSLGDEIIFVAEIYNHIQVAWLLEAMQIAVKDYNNKPIDGTSDSGLKIKAAVWTAGFPVQNVIIPIEYNTDNLGSIGLQYDFIGRNIDLGFRISKYSSQRKMIISNDVALLSSAFGSSKLKYYYEGSVSIKGLPTELKDYPLFWVDTFVGNGAESESRLYNPVQQSDMKEFVEGFYNSKSKYFMRPFINSDPIFNSPPNGYDVDLEAAIKAMSDPDAI